MEKSCSSCVLGNSGYNQTCVGCDISIYTKWKPKNLPRKVIIPTKLMGTVDPIFLPYRKHANDAGADLRARIESPIRLHPGQITKIPSGVGVEIPVGYVGLIQPRSGASGEGKVAIVGTIDSDYRGEMSMNMFCPVDSNYVVINPKERIAQLVVVPYLQTEFVQVDELGESERGENGFGSTGNK